MIQPPTDNLYKFAAIFGLILIGISLYFPSRAAMEYSRESAEWRSTWVANAQRLQELDDESKAVMNCEDELQKTRDAGIDVNTQPKCKPASELREALDEVRSITEELAPKGEVLVVQGNQISVLSLIGGLGSVLGLAIAALGFYFWYFKVQIYQDAELSNARR